LLGNTRRLYVPVQVPLQDEDIILYLG
jgi:hypothetical protein